MTTTKKPTKSFIKPTLKCAMFGHQWEGDSIKRTCVRCGKMQIARYVGDQWVDV